MSALTSNEINYPKGPQISHVAAVHSSGGSFIWAVDSNGSHYFDTGDQTLYVGLPGDIAVAGDWFGDGVIRAGVFRPSTATWYLANPDGQTYTSFVYGTSTDTPVVGDWLGNGTTRVGVYRGGNKFILDTTGDHVHVLEEDFAPVTGALPFIGDWNGDGRSKVGVFLNGYFYLDVNGNGVYDTPDTGPNGTFVFGATGDLPVAGDWNLDGITDIGIYRAGYFTLDSNGSHAYEGSDLYFNFGASGYAPVVFG